jgi:hypothetical protein
VARPGGARILKNRTLTREVRATCSSCGRSTAHLHGRRPHPPAWAPHTWTGSSTGEWVGTRSRSPRHLRTVSEARRSADERPYTMTEYIARRRHHHRDGRRRPCLPGRAHAVHHLRLDPTASVRMETCNASAFAESSAPIAARPALPARPEHRAHEWLKNEPGARRGGAAARRR